MADYLQSHSCAKRLFIACILFVGLCSWLFPEPASAIRRKTSTNRECAICHIMWLDEFKRKDVTTLIPYEPLPTVKTGKQDVASTEQMCFSCHDGFVLDSRFLWKKNRHNHPVGVIPSDDVSIPTAEGKTIFPLNEEGKMYCGTCHTAHGVDWKDKESKTIFMRLENKNSNICTACHLNRVTGPKQGNHPINKILKELPPSLIKAGSQFSDKGGVICQSCHRVHGSQQKKMLMKPNQNSDLCATCHVDKGAVRNSKHNLTITAPTSENTRGRKVAESGPCSACHIPHKAKGPKLWARPITAGQDRGSAYCLSCHKSRGIADRKTINANSHPVDIPVRKVGIIAKKEGWLSQLDNRAAPKAIVRLPLFDKQGDSADEGGNVTCLTCHDPHLWSADHAERTDDEIRNTEGDGSNSFLRIANNQDSALCKNCHRDKSPVAFSKHNLSISAPEEKNKDDMTVSRSGVCSACHVPHNGTGANMWARKVQGKASDVMSKCIGCHKKDAVAGKRTPGEHSHPIHVNLEKVGGKTDLPLFSEGRRVEDNGLIDCASCHNPHQWDAANPIAVSGTDPKLDGDASNSFLRLKATGDAALCVNCHKKKVTVIGTDHDLSVTAINAVNTRNQTVRQSGPCGLCHAVHNASQPIRLWSQNLGVGKGTAEKLCTGCHNRSGIAHKKVPVELFHPSRTLSVNNGRIRQDDEGKLNPPIFGPDGKHAEVGMITCLTCHDPHQWNPAKHQAGTGKNIEGDVNSSFLRHSSTEYFLCADCHADDSLYRYKYFHWPKSRPQMELEQL